MPAAAKDKVASTNVVMSVRQNEIYVYVPPSTAGASAGAGFGILGAVVGAVIDSSINDARTSAAEKAVKPLRQALAGFEFDPIMRDDMKSALSGVAWLHSGEVAVNKDFGPESYENAYRSATGSTVLLTHTDYRLSNDGDVLFVTLSAYIFQKDPARDQKPASGRAKPVAVPQNSIYRDVFTFRARVAGAAGDRDKNIALWAADNGAPMRSALTMASAKLARMLATDLDRPEKDAPAAGRKVKIEFAKGVVVATDDDGSMVRMEDGTLQYVTNSIVLQ